MRPIPKFKEKRLLRLLTAWDDFNAAEEACALFQMTDLPPARNHFFLSMAVCYCRPFFQSNGVGTLLSEYPGFPDFPDPEMNLRHSRMMDIRNNFLSHTAIFGLRAIILTPGATHDESKVGEGDDPQSYRFRVAKRTFYQRPEYAPWLIEVARAIRQRVQQDLERLCVDVGSRHIAPGGWIELETRQGNFKWKVPGTP